MENKKVDTARALQIALPATSTTATGFTANWLESGVVFIDVSTNIRFWYEDILPNYRNFRCTGTSQRIMGLTTGTTYYYRVRIFYPDRPHPYSDYSNIIKAIAAEDYYWERPDPYNVTKYYPDGRYHSLPLILIPTMPENVITIGESCFEFTDVEEVSGLDFITEIQSYAFRGSKLQELKIYDVYFYGNACFDQCESLVKVTLNGATQIPQLLFANCPITEIIISSDKVVLDSGEFTMGIYDTDGHNASIVYSMFQNGGVGTYSFNIANEQWEFS
jgi:hypothetical protein